MRRFIGLLIVALLSVSVAGCVIAERAAFNDGFAASERQDYATALRLWRPLADQGYAPAQNNLGVRYANGQGVPQDYAEAARWYRKAADQGNFFAQNNLGVMYADGQGVQQDYAEAMRWYRKAADQGNAQAQSNLEVILKRGRTPSAPPPSQTASTPPPQIASTNKGSSTSVPMKQEGGTFVVPVLINNAINLNFVVDSGAADVTIPSDVVAVMMRTGTLTEKDFGAKRTYVLADGSKVESRTFRIRSLKVGDRVVENVLGSEAHVAGALLLGQSFLGKFKSWSIDNTKHALVLE